MFVSDERNGSHDIGQMKREKNTKRQSVATSNVKPNMHGIFFVASAQRNTIGRERGEVRWMMKQNR
jgi:hypothetical protein